ncbi:unnamed protein product [Fusarium graminearum]|uniref:Uncharacterized protein n=1 Tax=Gibberella zeae TaxID=5518 RepID=A0A4E9D3L3_GIBZA|nr:unnamed protein product [Fusarium graminearum]CAF3649224.1 unnamed protein product [Fusarium graminearum]CAG1975242.1 unnamed protein product [Fusarium graminearum]CAG2006068.1 unnamed protein product [Fusarium graminearum]
MGSIISEDQTELSMEKRSQRRAAKNLRGEIVLRREERLENAWVEYARQGCKTRGNSLGTAGTGRQ